MKPSQTLQKVSGNIKKFYLFNFLREMVFWIPIVVLFWQSNGLTLTQIMLLQSLFAVAIILLEVPTGVIADKVGRKHSLVIGAFFSILGYSAYAISSNFWQFLIAEIILAFAASFVSGADSAFIYDTLKQQKKEENFKKVRGNSKSFGYLAAGISAIIGSLVATYSLRLTFWMSVFAMVLLFFVTLSFIEPKQSKKISKRKTYLKHTIECFKEAFTNKNILFLLLFNSLLVLFARTSLWFYQPYMKASGIPLAWFGVIWASFSLFAIFGSKYSHKLEAILGERNSLWFMAIMMSLSMIFMSYWFFVFGIIFIFMQQFIRGFNPPVIEGYTHKYLSSEKRATLMSIQNMSASLLFAILGPVFGYLADKYTLSNSLLIVGIISIISFSLLMFWNSRRKR